MTTLLLSPELFAAAAATIADEAHHHLFKVKRLQTGDRLRVVDGAGHARHAEIAGIDKRTARLALGETAPANEPGLQVEIYVAPPKPERAAWLVEKATELGVSAIHFIATEHDARAFELAQLARLRRIAVSAVEQCGRSVVPQIAAVGDLLACVERLQTELVPIIWLDGSGSTAPLSLPASCNGARRAIFVGPEGGWSPAERVLFSSRQIEPWSLGPTVLRVETAAVVGAGLLLRDGGVSR
ncbi:MAG: 16S rRNA (uracil(1498)-N(3))-methyltransferase [Thermoanaerobaculia bacterium]